MTKSDLFRQSHKITKEDKANYPEINYIVQFGLNLSSLYSNFMSKISFERNSCKFKIEPVDYDGYSLEVKYIIIQNREIIKRGRGKLDEKVNVIRTLTNFVINGRRMNGIRLDSIHIDKLIETKNNMIKEENEKKEKLINDLVSGELKLRFQMMGCDYRYLDFTTQNIEDTYELKYNVVNDCIRTAVNKFDKYMDIHNLKNLKIVEDKKEQFEITLEELLSERIKANQKKDDKLNSLIEKAKETGKKQFVTRWTEECNDDNEECDIDTITQYIDENGELSEVRDHNW